MTSQLFAYSVIEQFLLTNIIYNIQSRKILIELRPVQDSCDKKLTDISCRNKRNRDVIAEVTRRPLPGKVSSEPRPTTIVHITHHIAQPLTYSTEGTASSSHRGDREDISIALESVTVRRTLTQVDMAGCPCHRQCTQTTSSASLYLDEAIPC